MDSDWYTAVLEEYKSLRAEAVTARDAQLSVLRIGVALIAGLIALGATLRNEEFLGGLLLSVIVPILVILTLELWIGEIQRSVRAGAFVAAIEHRLALLFAEKDLDPPLAWETWLRNKSDASGIAVTSQQQKDSLVRSLVISGFLFLVAGGSCGLGLHFLWHHEYRSMTYAVGISVGISLVLLLVRAGFAVNGIKRRESAPDSGKVWQRPVVP
jgi:hypothetical protein